MEFLFKNLSPEDFEELAQDLLSVEFNVQFEKFKKGKDGGIDLRLLQDKTNTIAQVKHMLGSYNSTHRTVFKKEFLKAHSNPKIVNCTKYLLITSSSLSPANKTEIRHLSNKLIKKDNDIIGLEDIESRLNSNEKLIQRHFKLWISSTYVLTRILNNKVIGKSEDYYKRIHDRKLPLFVKTNNLDKALEILNQNRMLVLTGEPGIGKTTLSEFICLSFVGYDYQFVYSDSVDEAEDVFEPNKKQVFLIDDFLGSHFLETFTDKEENKILRLMERVEAHKDKILILNSRTTIFSQASILGIHWGEKNWNSFKYHLDIQDYTLVEKAKMLYNHLVFRELDKDYFEVVRENKSFLTIIKHKNFNPRIMEFITSKDKLINIKAAEYLKTIQSYLDNPSEIWLSAYKNQINDEQRWLLQTLFSFKSETQEDLLKVAFEKRLKYEVDNNGHKCNEYSFIDAIKGLQDGFIYRTIRNPNSNTKVVSWNFLNPSVYDFLLKHILSNENIVCTITECVCSFQQWYALFEIKPYFEKISICDIQTKIINEYKTYENLKDVNLDYRLISLFRQYRIEIPNDLLLKLLIEKPANKIDSYDLIILINEFPILESNNLVSQYLSAFPDSIKLARMLIKATNDLDDLKTIIDFFDRNILDWDDIKDDVFDDEDVFSSVNELLDSEAQSLIDDDDELYQHTDEYSVSNRVEELEDEFDNRLDDIGLDINDYSISGFDVDCKDIAFQNFQREIESNYHEHKVTPELPKEDISDIDAINVFRD